MDPPQVVRELKRDALGRVELLRRDQALFVRRVACGGRIPGSGWAARLLLARERRALSALAGLPGVPRLVDDCELLRNDLDAVRDVPTFAR